MILSQISPKLKRKASNQAFWPNLNPSLACSLITLWTMQVPNSIEDISNQGNLETWFFEIGLKLTLVTNSNRVFIRFTAMPFATFYEINEKLKITIFCLLVFLFCLHFSASESQSKRGFGWVESIWLALWIWISKQTLSLQQKMWNQSDGAFSLFYNSKLLGYGVIQIETWISDFSTR